MLLFYIAASAKEKDRFQTELVNKLYPTVEKEFHQNISTLKRLLLDLLQVTLSQDIILVLCITIHEERDTLDEMQEILLDVRLIIIVPDTNLYASVYRLYPRFVEHQANGFSRVADVLEKMISG